LFIFINKSAVDFLFLFAIIYVTFKDYFILLVVLKF